MPVFPMVCDAGHRFEFTGSWKNKPAKCDCSAPCRDDYRAKCVVVGVKQPKGFENKKQSVTEFYPRRDAARMAEALGDVGKRCIQPDGTVVYQHRGDAAKFRAAKMAYMRRERQKAIEADGAEAVKIAKGDKVPTEPIEGIPRGVAAAISERHAKMRQRDSRKIIRARPKGK